MRLIGTHGAMSSSMIRDDAYAPLCMRHHVIYPGCTRYENEHTRAHAGLEFGAVLL